MLSYSPDGRKGDSKFERERLRLQVGSGDEDSDREKASQRLPSYGLVLLLGVLLLLGYLTQLLHYAVPRVIGEEEAGLTRASEERTWRHLHAIVGNGPRVAGSPYHRQKTEELKTMLDQIAANATQSVRVDWQVVTGDYYVHQFSSSFVSAYSHASNIIALLEGESGFNSDGTTNSSILFNCHYDTVPTSPGASDNAIFCAALVESFLLLSQSQHKFKHNIIFLFNGAEENGLQAAHGFLQHPWSKGVTALFNLDSSGMNGKPMLFQATDPNVLAAYSSLVSMPSAQSTGEALFTSGIIPSDTDFRIFRDFGGIYGVDIAFNRYGHVYHTRFDALDAIHAGVLQYASNTILSLANAADIDIFNEKSTKSSGVFFDYLNWFMLSYSYTSANVFDAITAVFALSSVFYYLWSVGMRRRLLKEFFISVLATLTSFIAGCLAVMVLTLIMVASMSQLRYYTNPWMVVPMFWVPFLIAAVTVTHAFDRWRANKSGLNRSSRTAQGMAASRFIWSLAVVFMLFVPLTTPVRYCITVPLFLTTIFAFVSLTIRRYFRVNAWQHLLMELVFSIPAMLFIFSLCLATDSLMIPIMGRSTMGSPDYIVAAMNAVLVTLSCLPLAGTEILFSRRRLWIPESVLSLLALILMFLPLAIYSNGYPFLAPQRYNIFHSVRIAYDRSGAEVSRDSGLWAGHTDVNSPATLLSQSEVAIRNVKTDFTEDCERYLYCNLPTMSPRSRTFVPFSIWIEFPPPAPFNPTPGVQVTSRTCLQNTCTLNFTVTGTPHENIIMWPRPGVTLEAWSLNSDVVNATSKDGRPVYYIYHTFGTFESPQPTFDFSVQVGLSSNLNGLTDALLDVVFNANKNHNADEMTREFSSFVQTLPDWFNVAPYLNTRISYVF